MSEGHRPRAPQTVERSLTFQGSSKVEGFGVGPKGDTQVDTVDTVQGKIVSPVPLHQRGPPPSPCRIVPPRIPCLSDWPKHGRANGENTEGTPV